MTPRTPTTGWPLSKVSNTGHGAQAPPPLVPAVLPFVGHCWYLHHGERPRDVRSPDEYAGGPDLAIHGTQLELPASQQRKLVDLEPHEDT